jgi:hypothetical protein
MEYIAFLIKFNHNIDVLYIVFCIKFNVKVDVKYIFLIFFNLFEDCQCLNSK